MRRWLVFLCALAACGNQEICSPGGELTCTGPNGCTGTRVCNAAGTAFSDCECNGATGGMSGGVGGAGGGVGGSGGRAGTGGGFAGTGGGPFDAMIGDGPGGSDGMPQACNPVLDGTQNLNGCEMSSGPKCAVTFPAPSRPGVLACVPGGTVLADNPCSTFVDIGGQAHPGLDNCVDGFCTPFGVTIGGNCDRYCDVAAQSNCASGEACFFIAQATDGHLDGTCRKICDPFAGTSACPIYNSLAPNQACNWEALVDRGSLSASCNTSNGTAAVGAFCNRDASPPLNCATGGICLGDNVCHALCDDNHPCRGGQRCTPAQLATFDSCDPGTGAGCPNPCGFPGLTNCEQCNRISGRCELILTTSLRGGWCVSTMPDAGP